MLERIKVVSTTERRLIEISVVYIWASNDSHEEGKLDLLSFGQKD